MEIILSTKYQECLHPSQAIRNSDIIFNIRKLEEQGHADFLQTTSRLINPYGCHELLGPALDLHEVGFQLFLALPNKTCLSDSDIYRQRMNLWQKDVIVAKPCKFLVLYEFQNVFEMLTNLELSGHFVLRIQEFYDSHLQILLWQLFQHFAKVKIIKPHLSHCCDNTKFVVCESLKLPFTQLELTECPLKWQYWLTHQQNKFSLLRESWQKKAIDLCHQFLKRESKINLQQLEDRCLKDETTTKFVQKFINQISEFGNISSRNWYENPI